MDPKTNLSARTATMKLSRGLEASTLTARVPEKLSSGEFGKLAASAYDVISKLTNHPCMSGRIKFVVEDMFLNEIINVDLQSGVSR